MRRLKIYPNAYYNYIKNRSYQYYAQKARIQREIVTIYHEENGVPGYRMMHYYLQQRQIYCSFTTVYRYMCELGLKSIVRRKKAKYIKGVTHHIFPDLLNRNFRANKINQIWCSDFTYLPQKDASMRYNCTIIDLFDRSVVATLNGAHITSELAMETLKIALKNHTPRKGLILHTDQGSQYTSNQFSSFCSMQKIQQSMSRAGCPYDNAPMERFFNTFKNEFFNLFTFQSTKALDQATYEFVYTKYNHSRPHTFNNGLSPCAARAAFS